MFIHILYLPLTNIRFFFDAILVELICSPKAHTSHSYPLHSFNEKIKEFVVGRTIG